MTSAPTDRERAVRAIFREAGINPVRDERPSKPEHENGILEYHLPPLLDMATSLVAVLLRDAYGLREDDVLEFRFHE
jgi:hypothetical protein